MSEDATTRPTIETVLERINALGERMNEGFAAVGMRLDKMEGRLDRMGERLDKMDGRLNQMEEHLEQMDMRLDRTQAVAHEMRADFREFRARFKEPA
ncbi:MAG TPA: hypothetical protein VF591_03930 [Pyrinomonadaceae bacterium]